MISQSELKEFKINYCNENELIINIIKTEINEYFVQPILDVGSGMGDIAFNALSDKELIQIDILNFKGYPISKLHKKFEIDFFNYEPELNINTLFFSHSLQFLDDDVNRLNEQIDKISAKYLITITNMNDDFLGDVIRYMDQEEIDINPERELKRFPKGYKLVRKIPFSSDVVCPNFDTLVSQLSYLIELKDTNGKKKLQDYTSSVLSSPSTKINQKIEIFYNEE